MIPAHLDPDHPYWGGSQIRPLPSRRLYYSEEELFLMEERREDPDA